MKIGSILEDQKLEQRIAITPEIIKKYKSLGLEVYLSKNYGVHLGINDKSFENEGAVIMKNDEEVISISNAILQMNILNDDNLKKLVRSGGGDCGYDYDPWYDDCSYYFITDNSDAACNCFGLTNGGYCDECNICNGNNFQNMSLCGGVVNMFVSDDPVNVKK